MVCGGLRGNTVRTYSSAQKQYIDFCETFGLIPVPATETVLLRYLAYLNHKSTKSKQGLASSSMSVYLSAVRSLHVMQGAPAPPTSSPRIMLALKSVQINNPPPVQKLPICFQLLSHMCNMLHNDYDGLVWKAALSLGFFGCLRGAEYCLVHHFRDKNVVLVEPPVANSISFGDHNGLPYMLYSVKVSKTTTHGFKKYIGCSHNDVCAVCYMWTYLKMRASLCPIQPGSPLFVFSNGEILDKSTLNRQIKHLVSSLGIDPTQYTSHSLRAGSATEGSKSLSESEIARLGLWKSQAYKSYIRPDELQQIYVASKLVGN